MTDVRCQMSDAWYQMPGGKFICRSARGGDRKNGSLSSDA
jgi:hypothetical protein